MRTLWPRSVRLVSLAVMSVSTGRPEDVPTAIPQITGNLLEEGVNVGLDTTQISMDLRFVLLVQVL